MQNLLCSPPHANSTISDQVIYTYSASQRRGLLCSEYPLDSKERTDNQLNSPFRLSNVDKSATKKTTTRVSACSIEGTSIDRRQLLPEKVAYISTVRSGEVVSTGAQHDRGRCSCLYF